LLTPDRMTSAGERASCLHEGMQSVNIPSGLGSSLRRPARAKVLPVYFQQPTYLRRAGTAGQCHEQTFRGAQSQMYPELFTG
jgi:hypothetical protein